MLHRSFGLVVLMGVGAPFLIAQEPKLDATQVEYFEKKIRPLLAEHCQQCHSTQTKQRGGLTLDSRAAVLKGGDNGPAIVPGAPEKSRLIQAIGYKDVDLRMPPKGKLNDAQIADLTAWVKMGSPWPGDAPPQVIVKGTFNLEERKKHWAWQPMKRTSPPGVKRTDWTRSPIDRFILARLEAAQLSPAAPADKRTLLRRVTYDLIGLPPTPAEIDAFLADESPLAFERVVERLLASPHYGERWGRHWLDLMRYAETQGHEFDFEMPLAHLYRDYVVRALNADLPYDQFVIEHVAGDLLPKPRRHPVQGFNESIIGTGFWSLHEGKHSPVDVRLEEAERIDNQIDVLCKAFLGLTVSCARCHDHKFDAIPTRDYYALAGYLRSSRPQKAFIDDPEARKARLQPLLALQQEARALAVPASIRILEGQTERLARQFLGERPTPQETTKRLKTLALTSGRPESAIVFEDFGAETYRDWFVTGEAFGIRPSGTSDTILQVSDRGPVQRLVGPGIAHSALLSQRLQGVIRSRSFRIEKPRIFYRAAGKSAQINLIVDGFQLIRNPIYGGLTIGINTKDDAFQWFAMDVSMWLGHSAYVEILDDGPGYVAVDQIVFADDRSPADAPNALLTRELGKLEGEAAVRRCQEVFHEIVGQWRNDGLKSASESGERITILNWLLQNAAAPPERADLAKVTALLEQFLKLESSLPEPLRAMALADGTGEDERVFIRGSHRNLGAVAPRRFLEAVAGPEQPAPSQGSGRLELARRMVEPSNPLVARVLVNRIWQHHFGEGLVRSVDNFGVLGELPSHPELLDFLATEFIRRGWSIKEMHRLLVLSSTYQMASLADDAGAEERDPQNRLLHRMPIRRLEAETIRDAILSVSGRLDQKLYGPSVMPHLTPFMSGRGRPGGSGPLDGAGRRSLYVNVRRNFLTPMFLAFDYPIPFTTMGRRSVSNVPAQALTLMNNPFVLQQAELWAKRVLAEDRLMPRERVQRLYVSAFGRPPTDAELADALAFLDEQAKQHGPAGEARAWTDLCHVLINVKEFIFIN